MARWIQPVVLPRVLPGRPLFLQQRELAARAGGLRLGEPAGVLGRVGHTPVAAPGGSVERQAVAGLQQVLGDVEADAAGADDDDALADRLGARQHVGVAQHMRQLLAGDLRNARLHAAGQQHGVEAAQGLGRGAGVELQVDAGWPTAGA
jgi:hypothetical protein